MTNLIKKDAASPAKWMDSREVLDKVKAMYCKDLTDIEFAIFKHVCSRTGLDPSFKQIYPVKRKNKDGTDALTIQVGIDGYRLIAERTGKYAPGKQPTFTYDDKGKLISATAYVMKMTEDGTWHEVAANAFYSEYVQTYKDGRPTQFWSKMGHSQLAKCAEALALRKAFPGDLSGIYTNVEMEQADPIEIESVMVGNTIDISHKENLLHNSSEIKNENASNKLTKEQINEINNLLGNDQEYRKNILSFFGVESIDKVPSTKFKAVFNSCLRRREERLKAERESQLEMVG